MPAIELSPEQKAAYVSGGGLKCPVCQSNNLDGGDTDLDGPVIRADSTCLDCKAVWVDVYTLSDIEKVSSNEEEEG
jgi:hypothetical protein